MNQLEAFREIETFIFDVDGVMTDSSVVVLEDGKLLRRMSVRDGYALQLAMIQGYSIFVITGGKSEGVKERLNKLGISEVYLGVADKLSTYEEIVDTYDLNEATILYMGDDMPDYPVLRRVGLPTCPADAVPEIRALARYISPYPGGAGCVRDVIEKVLKLNDKWE